MATGLTPDQMKQFVREHFEDFVNKRNASVIRKNMTPDFYDHDGPGGKPTGVEGDEQMMMAMYKAMPDLHLTIEDMIAEGDKVLCRNVWRWTDPASGNKMQFHGFVLWRFEGNKIAERWATVTPPAREMSKRRKTHPLAALRSAYSNGSTGRGRANLQLRFLRSSRFSRRRKSCQPRLRPHPIRAHGNCVRPFPERLLWADDRFS